MEALHLTATVKKQVNVLSHGMGCFRCQLSADETHELLKVMRPMPESCCRP